MMLDGEEGTTCLMMTTCLMETKMSVIHCQVKALYVCMYVVQFICIVNPHCMGGGLQYLVGCVCVCLLPQNCCLAQLSQNLNMLQL